MDINPTSDQLITPVREHSEKKHASGGGGGAKFAQFLGGAVNMAGQLASGVAGAQTMGLGPIAGNLLGGGLNGGSGIGGIGGGGALDPSNQATQFEQLLQLQEQLQTQSQQFTALTNISKTDHETRMSAIRNIRGG
jgi:hypothetical protein